MKPDHGKFADAVVLALGKKPADEEKPEEEEGDEEKEEGGEDYGRLMLKAIKAGDAAALEEAVRACCEESYKK